MGRYSGKFSSKLSEYNFHFDFFFAGFTTMFASLASGDADLVLLPEKKFTLEQVLKFLEKRVGERKHAVVVVAEGAGQEFFEGVEKKKDGSGNVMNEDIGAYLKHKVEEHFSRKKVEFSCKYIDPSYLIRSVKCNSEDSIFCMRLAQMAAHGAMSGRTSESSFFCTFLSTY